MKGTLQEALDAARAELKLRDKKNDLAEIETKEINKDIDISNFGDPSEWQKEVRKDSKID